MGLKHIVFVQTAKSAMKLFVSWLSNARKNRSQKIFANVQFANVQFANVQFANVQIANVQIA